MRKFVFPLVPLLAAGLLHAAPTAVNDAFTTLEDVAAGSAEVNVINPTFEPGAAGVTPQK